MFKVFPLLFQYKIYYNFTIDLKMMNWIEMVDLDLNNKEAMCLRLGFGWYKMHVKHIEWASALVPPTPYLGGPVERGREREGERKKDR